MFVQYDFTLLALPLPPDCYPAALLSLALAACHGTPSLRRLPVSHGAMAYAPEIPQLTCAAHGNPNSRVVELTTIHTEARGGDPPYNLVRQRLSPGIPSSNLYVVFGRLDPASTKVTRQDNGLFPKGNLIGLYGGRASFRCPPN